MMIRILSAVAMLTLAGCVAMTPTDIRKQPKESYVSAAGVDAIAQCLYTRHPDISSVLTLPESRRVEVSITALQIGETRVFYLASIEPTEGGSTVTTQVSGLNMGGFPEVQFRRELRECAPPRA